VLYIIVVIFARATAWRTIILSLGAIAIGSAAFVVDGIYVLQLMSSLTTCYGARRNEINGDSTNSLGAYQCGVFNNDYNNTSRLSKSSVNSCDCVYLGNSCNDNWFIRLNTISCNTIVANSQFYSCFSSLRLRHDYSSCNDFLGSNFWCHQK
jgi:hypothetical protein